ncbi:MAG: hypothetical protein H0X38_03835 [Planctomycetes bacterium]|nr:hypothetical protein [Planctomycetota bacterium]
MLQRTISILIGVCVVALIACVIGFVSYLHAATQAWSPSGPGAYVWLKARSTLCAEAASGLLVAIVLLLAAHAHRTGRHADDADED